MHLKYDTYSDSCMQMKHAPMYGHLERRKQDKRQVVATFTGISFALRGGAENRHILSLSVRQGICALVLGLSHASHWRLE
jgi:hypothetical protein